MAFNEGSVALGVVCVPGTCPVRDSPWAIRTGWELTEVLQTAEEIIVGFKASDDVIMPEACAGPLVQLNVLL